MNEHESAARPDVRTPIENSYVVPGTLLVAGEYPGSPPEVSARERDAKLARFLDAGIASFIDLTEAGELDDYAKPLRALATQRGQSVNHERFPIVDVSVCDAAQMRRILDTIDAELAAGRPTYVHCWGGVGRTGTVVGCFLVRHGMDGESALAEVGRLFATMPPDKRRRHRSAPETDDQREMVASWITDRA